MGKIVKYCVSCDEGFAEKFGWCPTCGAQLQSFEMKPVVVEAPPEIVEPPVPPVIADVVQAEPPVTAQFDSVAPVESVDETPAAAELFTEPAPEISEEIEAGAAGVESSLDDVVDVQASEMPVPPAAPSYAAAAFDKPVYSSVDRTYDKKDDGYYVTVIQEKNVKQRNMLLLGSLIFIVTLAFSGTVYSLFKKDLGVGAIDSGDLFAFVPVVEEVPMDLEEEKKKDDGGGGGGGGGKESKDPTSQGRLATQTDKPLLAPDVSAFQKKTDMPMIASTQGDHKVVPTEGPYGDPNSRYSSLSNGPGSGGGLGAGVGPGMGPGRGPGMGPGEGPGYGPGEGPGYGPGEGPGSGPPPPPAAPKGPTVAMKIISKPRATYTDAGRVNNIQGNVTLRITFLASGQIGSISPVSRLPHGLTEQAISAARAIRFEPAKVNGVPQSKTMTVIYSFTMY